MSHSPNDAPDTSEGKSGRNPIRDMQRARFLLSEGRGSVANWLTSTSWLPLDEVRETQNTATHDGDGHTAVQPDEEFPRSGIEVIPVTVIEVGGDPLLGTAEQVVPSPQDLINGVNRQEM